ncbi:ATPase SWSAP1 isoform X2 [Salminus brasiliensis]|uniref:ATPase SWSAP1 isoform X2 n=1 Tax=Salminus brasiliensis TaxID=930266 RepID=UPI003B838A8A
MSAVFHKYCSPQIPVGIHLRSQGSRGSDFYWNLSNSSHSYRLYVYMGYVLGCKYQNKIRFVYPKTLEELLEDVASLHELVSEPGALPSLLIVDGLERYVCGPAAQDKIPQEAQSAAAHLVALLHDTAAFLTQKLGDRDENQGQSRVIVSFQPERIGQDGCDMFALDPLLSVLERYLPMRCTSEKVRRVEGQDEWLLDLSGPGLQVNGDGNIEKRAQWHVVVQPNGALEFCPVSPEKEDTPQGQNLVEVKDE